MTHSCRPRQFLEAYRARSHRHAAPKSAATDTPSADLETLTPLNAPSRDGPDRHHADGDPRRGVPLCCAAAGASRTLGVPLAPYFARRAISAIGWLLESHDQSWHLPLPEFCPDVKRSFAQWRKDVLAAGPRHIAEEAHPDLVIVVEASDGGWGALAVDNLNRVLFAKQRWSDTLRAGASDIFRAGIRYLCACPTRGNNDG